MKILYIIGNGFDLHHGVKSGYWHFREYVEKHNKPLFEALEKYFNPEMLWSDFEAALAELDIDKIRDEAFTFLISPGSDEWRDSANHDYQYDINQKVELVTEVLRKAFLSWILSLRIPPDAEKMVVFKPDASFLNFNYTHSLPIMYRIDPAKVLHIHNSAEDNDSLLILGHSRKPVKKKPIDLKWFEENEIEIPVEDFRVEQGEDIFSRYFVTTYKSTEKIISQNNAYFKTLGDLEEIHVFGHSLSPVDLPYFSEIIKNIDVARVLWKVSYYREDERQNRLDTLTLLGVPEELIALDKMENFDSPQLSFF